MAGEANHSRCFKNWFGHLSISVPPVIWILHPEVTRPNYLPGPSPPRRELRVLGGALGTWYKRLLSLTSQSPGSSLIEFTAGAIPVSPSKSRSLFPVSVCTKVRNSDEAELAPKCDVGQGGSPLHAAERGSFTGRFSALCNALSHHCCSSSLGPQYMDISRVGKSNLKKA